MTNIAAGATPEGNGASGSATLNSSRGASATTIVISRRMFRTRSSQDISIGYFLLLIPGLVLWVAYGVASHDLFLAVPNAVSVVVAAILILVAVRFRHGGGYDERDPPRPQR